MALTGSVSAVCRSLTAWRTPSFTTLPSRSIVFLFGGGSSMPAASLRTHLHYLVNVRIDLRMKDKPHQLRRLSIRWSSSSNVMPRDGFASNSASRRRASAIPSSSSCRTDGSDSSQPERQSRVKKFGLERLLVRLVKNLPLSFVRSLFAEEVSV